MSHLTWYERYHKEREEFYERLGFTPVPQEIIDQHNHYMETVVIPRIVQSIHDRTPTFEQLHQILR